MPTYNDPLDTANPDLDFGILPSRNRPSSPHLDDASRVLGLGGISASLSNAIYGHNHYVSGTPPIQANIIQTGAIFFIRPRLRLTDINIKSDRKLIRLWTNSSGKSAGATTDLVRKNPMAAIRAYLDPVGSLKYGYTSPLVDPYLATIPLLSNVCLTATGWPDQVVDTYDSDPGLMREVFSMVDGFPDYYGVWDLNCTFQNYATNMIGKLFYIWTRYQALVHAGVIHPWPDCILENEIDYMTRIYHFTLDPLRTYVEDASCCGVAFPTTNSTGALFNYDITKHVSREVDSFNVQFKAIAVDYYDQIIVDEFNRTIIQFNPYMHDNYRLKFYRKLTGIERAIGNWSGYPRVDPNTGELEWWGRPEIINNAKASIKATLGITL